MPLGKDIQANIRELVAANKKRKKKRPMDQIIAIAHKAAGKSRRK